MPNNNNNSIFRLIYKLTERRMKQALQRIYAGIEEFDEEHGRP